MKAGPNLGAGTPVSFSSRKGVTGVRLVSDPLGKRNDVYDLLGLTLGFEWPRYVNRRHRRSLGERHIPEPIAAINRCTFSLHNIISFRSRPKFPTRPENAFPYEVYHPVLGMWRRW